jgi:hypothetical protein
VSGLSSNRKLSETGLEEMIAISQTRSNPEFYDRMMLECYRGGLKSPHIVQEGVNEPTILSLVSTGMGVGWSLQRRAGDARNPLLSCPWWI